MMAIKVMGQRIIPWWIFLGAIAVFLSAAWLYATPEHAERTEQGCKICHVEEEGGKLAITGLEYAASGYRWPPVGGYRVHGPIRKSVRLVIGYFHILSAFIWFGTILYVHLLLKPQYAERGLPKGEVVFGLVSMITVGVSGVLLTVSKVRGLDVLFTSPWGIVLTIKILFYVIMVSSAIFVVVFLGPRLRRGSKVVLPSRIDVFDPLTLSGFDGKEGRPAYFAYREKVYDVTGIRLWREGKHMKHSAGMDISAILAKAPHGEEKLEALPVVGVYDGSLSPPKSPAQKIFYFIAYMNLILVFFVLFVIAYWRWGI